MTLKLFPYAIILILAIILVGTCNAYQHEHDEKLRQKKNVVSLRSALSDTANELHLTKKEFKKLFREKDSIINSYGIKSKDLKQYHAMAFSRVHDTVAITDTLFIDTSSGDTTGTFHGILAWNFDHGCIKTKVVFDVDQDSAREFLTDTFRIDRIVKYDRPKWYKFINPKNWYRSNWPLSTIVKNNCGLKIEENTIIEIE